VAILREPSNGFPAIFWMDCRGVSGKISVGQLEVMGYLLPGSARVSRAASGVSPDASEREHPARKGSGGTPKPARGTRALPRNQTRAPIISNHTRFWRVQFSPVGKKMV